MGNRKSNPPAFPIWLLKQLTDYQEYFAIAGDVEEVYTVIREERKSIIAYIWIWYQLLVGLSQYLKRKIQGNMIMFSNYIKTALRNLVKQKGYSVINMAGLAIGMACCILILLWVQDELSFDRFHKNLDQIYRIVGQQTDDSGTELFAITPAPIANAFKKDFPEIEKISMLGNLGTFTVKCGDITFSESRYRFVNPDFFDIFTFPLIAGDPIAALKNPNSVILTKAMVDKYFPDDDPMGKVLTINSQFDVTVTGIMEDVPENSSITLRFVSPFELLLNEYYGPDAETIWDRYSFSTFLTLSENASADAFKEKILNYKQDNIDPESNIHFTIQPFDQLHLHSTHIIDGYGNKGSTQYVFIFSILAILILSIACINFINLMTARTSNRAREVGMRKVVGAHKSDIIKQFFGETMILAFIAFFLSLMLVSVALPEFNNVARKSISLNILNNVDMLIGLTTIVIFTGILAGSYPAIFISRFQPIKILKDAKPSDNRKSGLRKILVMSQFTLSIILIICATVLSQQLHYIRNKDIGYDRDQLITIAMPSSINDRFEMMKGEFLRLPGIINVAGSSAPIPWKNTRIRGLAWEGSEEDNEIRFSIDHIDANYLEAVNIELVLGRNFSREMSTDTTAYLLNQEAIRQMGLEDPIGKRFELHRPGPIIGIVKDFIFDSFHNPMEPLVLAYEPSRFQYLHIKMQPHDVKSTISKIESKWKQLNPNTPFHYDFVSDDYEYLSRTEERISTIFQWSAFLGIFISCLGLIGLASFVAEQRTKEVGIRKVLGASETGIIALMTSDFLKWTLVANIVAWPVAWIVTSNWLKSYAYRIELGWVVFILAGISTLLMAILTVGFHAIRVARANPIDSLRYE